MAGQLQQMSRLGLQRPLGPALKVGQPDPYPSKKSGPKIPP